jgi:haloalkane dehalogenase
MQTLRTPAERFQKLPGFDWEPHYTDVRADDAAALMAYVDEGPRQARAVLLLHGEPSWSYLYRNMIPPLLDAGLRAIAPDLIGFGRSDKPTDQEDSTRATSSGSPIWSCASSICATRCSSARTGEA